jgi:hypothetical protein
VKRVPQGALTSRTVDGYATELARIKRKLIAGSNAKRDLDRIVAAGANRAILVDLIAKAVIERPEDPVAERMRSKQTELKSIDLKLRTLAPQVERLAKDSSTYLEHWSPFANKGHERHKEEETKRRASLAPFQAMLDYAEWAKNQATSFGQCLRRNSQKESKLGVLWLLLWVHSQTGNLFENELARLLTDAAEAAGLAKDFSASQLRKMFDRNIARPSAMKAPDISTP